MTKTLAAIAIVSMLTGGCARFRYDADDEAPPPQVPLEPTPTPVAGNSMTSPTGIFREVFIDLPGRVADKLSGNTATDAVMKMEDGSYSDRRREGINDLVGRSYGKEGVYTTRYAQIAQFDRDPMVRATAIRALNRARDVKGTAVFIKGLSDESRAVRLESAKALANVPSNEAAAPLLKLFTNTAEETDIRIAAADALRHYRTDAVAQALVDALTDRDFSVAWQSRQSLRSLTGADQRYSQAAWTDYLKQNPLS
jgi:hypothetical protein